MSCLFNSLSHFYGESSESIRGRICDYLSTNPALYDDMDAATAALVESGLPLDRYVERMRSMGTWGGAIEIRAAVQLWQRPVRVWAIRYKRWIEFPWTSGDVCCLSWTGGHYEPMTCVTESI